VKDSLVVGRTYRFISRCRNLIGYSEFSTHGYIAYGGVPTPPPAPVRVFATETTISVQWTAPSSSDLPITGYVLNMDDGTNTDLLPIYNGFNRPDVLQF
jgi:hypothetical protein